MSGMSEISVAVDGFYSEEVATGVGMYRIRHANGVTGSEHVRTYRPQPLVKPTLWRVVGTYPPVPPSTHAELTGPDA